MFLAFLSLDSARKVSFNDQIEVKDDLEDPAMDAYIANVLAGSTDDESMDEESLTLEQLRKKRASKELDSAELELVKQPEIHTYQEIVEVVEIIETVPISEAGSISHNLSITDSRSVDVEILSDATHSDVEDDILSDGESEMDIGEYSQPDVGPLKLKSDISLAPPTPSRLQPSPMRAAPSPALANIVGSTLKEGSNTPILTQFKERKAEDIVKEIEVLCSSPLPPLSPLPEKVVLSPIPSISPMPKTEEDDYVMSDAADSITDHDVLSDASDSEDDTMKADETKYAAWASVNVGAEEQTRGIL